jgi:predicted nuclease of restriction endonuclease-like (RecB) superfamily
VRHDSWGAKIVDQLAVDLRRDLPDMTGLSLRNLRYMRTFAEAWPNKSFSQDELTKLPWYHNIALLEKIPSPDQSLWYAQSAIENGWSRDVLVIQIGSKLLERQGNARTSSPPALPPSQSDLVRDLLTDPYNLELLVLQKDAEQTEIGRGLVIHIQKFLLELGAGFAFVGRQFHLVIEGGDFYIDLLFYHYKLRCFVVIELKSGKFTSESASKMNFYLALVDDFLRHPDEAPSIGLILCKEKGRIVAEYALRNIAAPIGISEYKIGEALPNPIRGSLPTFEQLEMELVRVESAEAYDGADMDEATS